MTTVTRNIDPSCQEAHLDWLWQAGFQSAINLGPEKIMQNMGLIARDSYHKSNARLMTIPGSQHYIPPVIPSRGEWMASACKLVHLSFLGLIADVWTQFLVLKRDHKEKPIYLLWDDEIPKPNPLSALAWMLTCESWPYPNHKVPQLYPHSELTEAFPYQSFVLPQSTPYGYASSRPTGGAVGLSAYQGRGLTGLLTQSMHREDRQRMELVREKTAIHRPQLEPRTSYQQHERGPHSLSHNIWSHNSGWPYASSKSCDQNIAAVEWQESYDHIAGLQSIRASVMYNLLTIPGLPTHRDNLHHSAGMWIREWSESGIICGHKTGTEKLDWTPDKNPVKLADGPPLKQVPTATPRIWLGWSHIGPKWEAESGDTLRQIRTRSDSELWADAYIKHRGQALRMLFNPESVDTAKLLEDSASARAKLLGRAGRLKDTGSTPKGSSISNAFAQFLNNAPKIED